MTGVPEQAPQTFGFLVVPQFSLLNFGAASDPLRSANRLTGRNLYSWRAYAMDDIRIPASNGIDIVANSLFTDLERIDNLIVVAGLEPYRYAQTPVLARLRRLARSGCRLGAISTGSYILAKAGLLDGYKCTIHWESLDSFREEFPKLEVTQELYEIDRDRMTCSGGTAAMDMMLGLIALDHGRDLATAVAEQFIHGPIRDQWAPQRMDLRSRLGTAHPKLLAVVGLMEQNLEDPLARSDLARRVGLSTRQLERLFRGYLKRTPTRYYLELRLLRARGLLTQTAMSVLDVAMACGFVSASHFSKCYRDFFERTPREDRSDA